jgi:type III secretory pathway component EscR
MIMIVIVIVIVIVGMVMMFVAMIMIMRVTVVVTAALGVHVIVRVIVAAGFTMLVMMMVMIMSMIVAAAVRVLVSHGEQIEETEHDEADACDEHHGNEESFLGEIHPADEASAGVEVDQDAAPQEEQCNADVVDEAARRFHGGQ